MKATLITGASGGIGEIFARKLAAQGHNLVLVARSEDKLHALCDELMLKHKITAHYIAVDLLDFEADKRVFEETETHGIEIDWLINNAGFGAMDDFTKIDLEKQLDMIGLNIMVLVALTYKYLRRMRERGRGVIINVSSTASFQPLPYFATYAATKAFVTSFTEAIAEENKTYGIQVLNLCPGATETNFFAAGGIDENLTVKGMQTPEQVVDAALSGVKSGKRRVISGFVNKATAYAVSVIPNSLITWGVGSKLRKQFGNK